MVLPENVTVAPDDIYWVQKNRDLKKFTSERQFIKLFHENGDKLKDFFRQNKIDLNSKVDQIKLENYCDKLEFTSCLFYVPMKNTSSYP